MNAEAYCTCVHREVPIECPRHSKWPGNCEVRRGSAETSSLVGFRHLQTLVSAQSHCRACRTHSSAVFSLELALGLAEGVSGFGGTFARCNVGCSCLHELGSAQASCLQGLGLLLLAAFLPIAPLKGAPRSTACLLQSSL